MENRKEKFIKKLLVEGKNDQHVVWALCEKMNIPETFDVIDCNGIKILLEDELPIRMKGNDADTIGIIIDADVDLNARWQSIKATLSKHKFNSVPDNIPDDGLIVSNTTHKVGVWIMPDNHTNGMLEDFISFLIPENDQLLSCVSNSLDLIESHKLEKYKPVHKSKAMIHTWLAWQENPGTPMGQAITKKYLTTEADLCNDFINWLKKLFY